MFASLLGVRLQPWQQHALDVAGELIPDPEHADPDTPASLVHAYSTVIVSAPRRAGKSLATIVRLLATISASPRSFAWYTAQNGKAAAERFRNDWVPLTQAAPALLSDRLRPRLTNGTETLTDLSLDSYLRIFSPIPTALHGDAADLIVFDEGWAHSAARGKELEVASFPLMATRAGAQLFIMSAAGDMDSEWWNGWLDAGRASLDANTGTGVCHLEWSADGADPDTYGDEQLWLDTHPGIRCAGNADGVVRLSFLRAEYERDPGQFARSYLNVTDRTGTTSAVIDPDAWQLLGLDAQPDRGNMIALGVGVAPEQEWSTLTAAYFADDHLTLELIDRRPGHSWVTERVAGLCDAWPIGTVALDSGGQSPASVLARPLRQAGAPLVEYGLADVTAAAADLVSAIRGADLRHVPHPDMDAAVAAARRRLVGDGSWTFGQRDADSDVSPVIAAMFARWSHPHLNGVYAGIH